MLRDIQRGEICSRESQQGNHPLQYLWRRPRILDDHIAFVYKEILISSLHTAFSRGSPGRYVQDLLRQDSARIATWLAQGAQVRVCGSQAMAQAVEAVLQDILARQGQSLHELKEAQRYAQDVF